MPTCGVSLNSLLPLDPSEASMPWMTIFSILLSSAPRSRHHLDATETLHQSASAADGDAPRDPLGGAPTITIEQPTTTVAEDEPHLIAPSPYRHAVPRPDRKSRIAPHALSFPTAAPMAPIQSGNDTFLWEHAVPWGRLLIDGKPGPALVGAGLSDDPVPPNACSVPPFPRAAHPGVPRSALS